MARLARVALAVVLLAGCARSSRQVTKSGRSLKELRAQVEKVSEEAQALLKAQDELVWKSWTTGAPVDMARTYAGHEKLFTPENILAIREVRDAADDAQERRGLTHLLVHFVGEYLAQQTAEVSNAIANVEASARVEVAGKQYPFRDLERLLANEKDPEKRHALYAGARPAVDRISQSIRRKEQRMTELLKGIGYPSYNAFAVELREVDEATLKSLAEDVLSSTDSVYDQVVTALSQRELSQPKSALTRADLPRLFRPKGVDAFFPKEAEAEKVKRTAAGLGLPLEDLSNAKLDWDEDPKRNPRALTLPVEIPDDVRMSAKPFGGVDDYGSMLHEMAHVLHYANSEELPFALAKLGNPTVAEAYGFLFEDLLQDPLWLQQNTTLPKDRLEPYLAASNASALFQLRRSAAAILNGLESDDEADAKKTYAGITARAYGVPATADDEARYLVDREDFLASADTLRSALLAGQLEKQLKARFGATWWTQPKAGEWLVSLWKFGQSKSADEIAEAMGEKRVAPGALVGQLTSSLATLSAGTAPTQATDGGESQ